MLAYTTPARGEVIPARRGVGCLFREWVFGDTSVKISRMFPTLFYFKFVRRGTGRCSRYEDKMYYLYRISRFFDGSRRYDTSDYACRLSLVAPATGGLGVRLTF